MMTDHNVLQGPPGIGPTHQSFGQYVLNCLRKLPTRIIQIDAMTGQTLTNRDILERGVKLAKVLQKHIKSGDTVAITSENSLNWFVAACGTIFSGAIVAPVNPAYLADELKHNFSISQPRVIFVSRLTEVLVNSVVQQLPWKVKLIQLDDESVLDNVQTLRELLKNSQVDVNTYEAPSVDPTQEFVVLSSSGTTGLPKGVMLSHRNFFAIIHAYKTLECGARGQDSVFLIILPFFHGYGFATTLFAMTIGAKVVIMTSFEPKLFCESIQRYKVTNLPLAPPLMAFLAKHPLVSKFDFSSLEEIVCGAAPLPINAVETIERRFPRIIIRNGYGMTELSVVISLSPRQRGCTQSVGRLTPGTTCQVVDPVTLKPLAAYQTGELCFKGDHVMLGYRGDPEATRQTVDSRGWLYSGDLGYYDHEERLFVVGRLKELIKYKGFQIAPAEIENILLSHPYVDDAAVVGRDVGADGQVPVAFVVTKIGASVTGAELQKFVDDRVSRQKQLRGGVQMIKAIPKNPGGKILRKKLHQLISKL